MAADSCPATLGPGCLGFSCSACGRVTGTMEADVIKQLIDNNTAERRHLHELRRRSIMRMIAADVDTRTIAKRYGITQPRVVQISQGK